MQAATDLAKVSVKGDAQAIASLRAWLTWASVKDVRLAAVTAIGQVAEKNDPEAIKLSQASLCDHVLPVSQTAALILREWAGKRDKLTDVVAHLVRLAAATAIGQVAEKNDHQVVAGQPPR